MIHWLLLVSWCDSNVLYGRYRLQTQSGDAFDHGVRNPASIVSPNCYAHTLSRESADSFSWRTFILLHSHEMSCIKKEKDMLEREAGSSLTSTQLANHGEKSVWMLDRGFWIYRSGRTHPPLIRCGKGLKGGFRSHSVIPLEDTGSARPEMLMQYRLKTLKRPLKF